MKNIIAEYGVLTLGIESIQAEVEDYTPEHING